MTEESEQAAILTAMHHIGMIFDCLSLDGSLCALVALTAQQICCYPPSERDAVLASVIRDLPGFLNQTETNMRIALARNARGE